MANFVNVGVDKLKNFIRVSIHDRHRLVDGFAYSNSVEKDFWFEWLDALYGFLPGWVLEDVLIEEYSVPSSILAEYKHVNGIM